MTQPTESSYTWSEDTFLSEGTECAVRVYRPAGKHKTVPVVVMAHGFGGVRALRLYAYAERFAAAGYAVTVFDYRGFGDSAGTPRQVLDVRMQHQDWRAALAYARTLPGVDPDRVVAWGTSFAGGHVISLAGQGEPLAAIIAQVPHVSGPAAVRATGLLPSLRVGIVGIRDQVNAWTSRSPVYVDSAGRPGQTAVMTSPDALPGMNKLITESGLKTGDYPSNVAARIVLKIGLYSPKRWARGVTCPALIQIADQDAVTPRHVAEAAAARMAAPTVRVYSAGHFDPYIEPLFTTVIADQIAFLHDHVPTETHQP
ncbi:MULTISPECIES: alpha/beta hydrolase [unclassified Nocardioides]|uniref:alpha/beta hydrolase n=1 Tax=unclassified Nocardioides TaxID=2615069 RepID=UPI0006F8C375|nr:MULTISPECIES: alpha/beta hydrolase [unclassified Nocardioides]KRA32496.1 alpha/beta hydrolase [Nocardioides sp. Root614]KRA89150.1 alpha/beta hydrolase [Nocardioides sp. Root682]